MSFGEAIGYIAAFGLIWIAVILLAASLDTIFRRMFGIKMFPDNYWQAPKSGSALTHCTQCNAILIDRDYCRNCGEVNI